MRQPTKRRRSCVLTLKYIFICVYWWTRQRIHNTLIVVDRYLRLMGDKTIPDSAEPRLESFYPPFVAGIDLPHQGVVDSYSLVHPAVRDKRRVSEIDLSQPGHEIARARPAVPLGLWSITSSLRGNLYVPRLHKFIKWFADNDVAHRN